MRKVGCEKSVVTLKTDNEPMLKAVADVVATPSGLSGRIVRHILFLINNHPFIIVF